MSVAWLTAGDEGGLALCRGSMFTAGAIAAALALGALGAIAAPYELGAVLVIALVLLGTRLSLTVIRGLLLAALLLVPDVPSGESWGFMVHWSQGLTWSNFVIPALALPLLLGVALTGRRLTPRRWPGLARGCLMLLGWCLVSLLIASPDSGLSPSARATLWAHWVKLALFLWLGVVVAGGCRAEARGLRRVLWAALAVNAVVGLAQAVRWLPVFSPLGDSVAGLGVRASGLFYDANMYGVLSAWALLWLLHQEAGQHGARRMGYWLLALAAAGNLASAASRAGFLALAAGTVLLLWCREWRTATWVGLIIAALVVLAPARGWQRMLSAAQTVRADVDGAAHNSLTGGDATTSERLASMSQAWRQIRQHPFWGLGFGRALYLGVPAIEPGPVRPMETSPFEGAQDMPLTVLAETGPVGLLLFLAAVASSLRGVARHRAMGTASFDALPLLAGYAGLLAACFTIEALWNARLLMLVVVLTTLAVPPEPEAAV